MDLSHLSASRNDTMQAPKTHQTGNAARNGCCAGTELSQKSSSRVNLCRHVRQDRFQEFASNTRSGVPGPRDADADRSHDHDKESSRRLKRGAKDSSWARGLLLETKKLARTGIESTRDRSLSGLQAGRESCSWLGQMRRVQK